MGGFFQLQNVRLAKVALRPGAGNLVNAILRKLVLLKVCVLLYSYNQMVTTMIFVYGLIF